MAAGDQTVAEEEEEEEEEEEVVVVVVVSRSGIRDTYGNRANKYQQFRRR